MEENKLLAQRRFLESLSKEELVDLAITMYQMDQSQIESLKFDLNMAMTLLKDSRKKELSAYDDNVVDK